jgi:hypothetical protein
VLGEQRERFHVEAEAVGDGGGPALRVLARGQRVVRRIDLGEVELPGVEGQALGAVLELGRVEASGVDELLVDPG